MQGPSLRKYARNSYYEMVSRCTKPNDPAYANYGGRGITICERWSSFQAFYEDMGSRPKGLSLGRIDNNLGYFPENCRWETREQQNQNTRLRRDNKVAVKGLYWDKTQNIWRARRRRNHIIYNLYHGTDKSKAIEALILFEKEYSNEL